MRIVVVLLLTTMALVGAQVPQVALPPPHPSRYYVHVLNGMNNVAVGVHCQSKNNDLGYKLLNHGVADYQWNFKENFWGTTLFWCKLEKPHGYVSFEAFWPESKHTWLRDRCGNQRTCIWTAKDDGIYLRNLPTNVDELVHKWISSR